MAVFFCRSALAVDTYFEDFSGFAKDHTIDEKDYWKVTQGSANDVIVQNYVTFPTSQQALKVTGEQIVAQFGRSTDYYQDLKPLPVLYGNVSPVWVRLRLKPTYSAQIPNLPATGIAAVCLDYSGRVLASTKDSGNNKVWVDTGATYTTDKWYDVLLKLDFGTHTYDLYFFDSLAPSPEFIPVMTGLKFLGGPVEQPLISTLSNLRFSGAYSKSLEDDVYIDYVMVSYVYRLEVITLPQKLFTGQASSAITVQLQDFNANPQTTPRELTLDLKSTSSNGRFSLSRQPWEDVAQVVMPKFAQSLTFYYKDTVKGKPIITVKEYPEQGFVDAIQEEEIVSEVSAFDVEAQPRQGAGRIFKIKVIAKDDEGNINENYGGIVSLQVHYVSPESGSFQLAPAEASGFVRGAAEANVSYPDCGIVTITAQDTDIESRRGTSQRILFLPVAFSVSADAGQVSSKPFSLSVTARNASGDITPNYNTAVRLYPEVVLPPLSTAGAVSPAVIEGVSFTKGIAKPDIAYNFYGTIRIRAEDTNDITKHGTSSEIKFMPKGIGLAVNYSAGRNFFYVGEPVSFTVKILDYLDGAVPNYRGIVGISGSGAGLSVPLDYNFTENDAGAHTFSAATASAGTYRISVQAENGLFRAESADILVKDAYLQVIDTESPVGTGEVIIELVDENGKVITSENNLPITVQTQEEVDNTSAYVPSGPVGLRNGRAIIPITDLESEVVTIIPSSPFKIKVKKGTVTFGPLGRSGINTLMWRELKEGK